MANLGDVLRQVVCTPKHIPDDWAFLKLTDVCSPKQWKTISSVEMTATGYPVFGANGFVGFYPEYNHADETVAITCRGNTCGTINRIPPKTYITGNSMALDDIKSNVVLQEYLYYALKYRGVGDSVSGSAQPQITGAGLRSIEFPAPPLPEQQKIATILSSVDDVIEKTRAQIDKLKDLKTGMMQELLTKGIGHTEFKDSPVGRIPVEWDVVSIGDILEDRNEPTSDEAKYVLSSLTIEFGLVKKPERYIRDFLITDKTKDSYKVVHSGDFVLNPMNLRWGAISRSNFDNSIIVSKYYNVLKPKLNVDIRFYESLFKSELYLQRYEEIATGTLNEKKRVHWSALKDMKIPLPSENELGEMGARIEAANTFICIKNSVLKRLEELKKALMQDLLTGKVRVNLTDKESTVV